MKQIEQDYDDIFLFVLGNGADEYAEIKEVYKRKQPGLRLEAWKELKNGKESDWLKVAAPSHRAGGIDMAFPAKQSCLVFVAISGEHSHKEAAGSDGTVGLYHDATTYFGKKIVTDQVIHGKLAAPIIKSAKRYKLPGSGYPTVCSFEVDVVGVMAELRASSTVGTMTRFPIVFDFVDSDDDRSPVFKKPHRNSKPPSPAGLLARLGHGGIHPRGGSSIIELN